MANSINDNNLMEQDGQFWSWYQLEQGQWRSWSSGQLNLQMMLDQDEILLTAEYREDDGDSHVTGRPDSSDRYITGGVGRIGFLPAMPDRPLVLKPRIPRRIPPGVQVQLMFFIPVWIQILMEKKGGNVLLKEYPSVILSSTWFGDMQSGELCYTLGTELFQNSCSLPEDSNLAACILNIRNNSSSMLEFTKMAVHAEYLTLFTDGNNLYTNEITVDFNGAEQISQLKYSPKGPKCPVPLRKVNVPRDTPSKSLLKRSFSFIKLLTEM